METKMKRTSQSSSSCVDKAILCVLAVCGWLAAAAQPAHAAPVRLDLSSAGDGLQLQVAITGKRWRQVRKQNWEFVARLSRRALQRAATRLEEISLGHPRWRKSYRKSQLCGRAQGPLQLLFQVGIRYRQWWWNHKTRKWQRDFFAIYEQSKALSCKRPVVRRPVAKLPADVPNTLPPGQTPPRTRSHDAPPGSLPPAAPMRRAQPRPSPPVKTVQPPSPRTYHPPVRQPVARPAPTNTPKAPAPAARRITLQGRPFPGKQFWRFHTFLKQENTETRRIRLVEAWLKRRVRPRKFKLRFNHVRVLLKSFRYASARLKVAQSLSFDIRRPLRARQVGRLLKLFSYDSDRAKVAIFYCKGLADPNKLHHITDVLEFRKYQQSVLKACR